MTEEFLVAILNDSLPPLWNLVSDCHDSCHRHSEKMFKQTPGDILNILARSALPNQSNTKVTRLFQESGGICPICASSSPVKLIVDGTLFDGLNLGMICTIIYHWLYCHDWPNLILPGSRLTLSHLQYKAKRFKVERESHIVNEDLITDPYSVGPRRVWDLFYNRVVPYYLLDKKHNSIKFVAISHSWVPSNDRISVYTPINHHAWPVPLPKGVDLDDIRAEVQELYPGVRYCWLDVLCLRQEGTLAVSRQAGTGSRGNEENWLQALYLDKDYASGELRSAELKIDVPTIGNIYLQAQGVIRYFNGLGRGFRGSDFNDPTHWLNRAWTLQEAVPNSVSGGVRPISGNYRNVKGTRGGVTKRLREFLEEVEAVASGKSVVSLAYEMGTRHAMNAMDKIAGLSFILRFEQLPVYLSNEPISAAWGRCLSAMPAKYLEEIFINCPIIDQPKWVPGWDSLLTCSPSFVHSVKPDVDIYENDSHFLDRLALYRLELDRPPREQGSAIYLEVYFIEVSSLGHVAGPDYEVSSGFPETKFNFFVSHDGDIAIQGLGSYAKYYLAAPCQSRGSYPDVHSPWIVLGVTADELEVHIMRVFKARKLGVLRTDEYLNRQWWIQKGYIEAYLNSGNVYLFLWS